MNVGKTLGQKSNVRTRINFGNGLFWTKQKTLGADQQQVHSNLSNVFGVEDSYAQDTDYPNLMVLVSLICAVLSFVLPLLYIYKLVPFMELQTGYNLIWSSWTGIAWHSILIVVNGALGAFAVATVTNIDNLLAAVSKIVVYLFTALPIIAMVLCSIVWILAFWGFVLWAMYQLVVLLVN
jgi:hypothetical protein